MTTFPFPTEAITAADPLDILHNTMTGRTFRAAIGEGALMSVGAHQVANVPGRYQLGGLVFLARILPMTKTGRSEQPSIMGVLVSLTPADEIDIEVIRASNNQEHATILSVYIDQLDRLILALDYDGPEVLNPRYWQ